MKINLFLLAIAMVSPRERGTNKRSEDLFGIVKLATFVLKN